MQKSLTIIAGCISLLLVALPCAAGKKAQGSLELQHLLSAGGNEENAAVTIDLDWTLWTLLDEPVVNSTARWQLHSVTVDNEGKLQTFRPCPSGNLIGENCIPASVLQKVRVYGLKVFAACDLYELRQKKDWKQKLKPSLGLLIDPGVMGKPAVDLGTQKTLKGNDSYNMPGSPNWDRLFLQGAQAGTNRRAETAAYASETIARGIVREGVKLQLAEISDIAFDLSAVKTYLLERKKTAAREADKELATLTRERTQARAEKKQIDENDFLAAFENDYLTAHVEETYQQAEEQVLAPFEAEEADIVAEQKRVSEILAAKRQEIDGRSLPGTELVAFRADNGRYGFKNAKGKTVIPANYGYAQAFQEGLAAVKDIDTGRWGFIDKRGTLAIPYRYTKVTPFERGTSSVYILDRYQGRCSKRREYGSEGVIGADGRWRQGPHSVTKSSHEFCLQAE